MTADELVDRLTSLYDVGETRALAVLNERLGDMVARSTALRAVVTLGTTVADQASYALAANVVQILKAEAQYTDGTVEYEGNVTLQDLWDVAAGDSVITGAVIAIEADGDSTMTTDNFRVYPAPTEADIAITGLVALRPATLTYGASSALPIPVDHHARLLAGCKATLADEEDRQDQAAKWEAEFETGVKLLEGSVNKRGKGSGSHRIRVVGYDVRR